MADDSLKISLLTIGDSQVGKSSLLLRFTSDSNKYNPQTMPTIGIDFKMKTVDVDGARVKLQIWDTAGQERFRTITKSYYRKVEGILVCYDITDRTSFSNVRSWIAHIQSNAETNVNIVLVGNKFDLAQRRAVTYDEGDALAREYHMPFFETSAVTNTNVDNAFMTLVADTKVRLDKEASEDSAKKQTGKVNLKNSQKQDSSSCAC